MATWKKVIVSGSDAALSSLSLTTALPVSSGGTGKATHASGHVLLGNGTSAFSSVARGNITGNTKIVVTGGSSAVLGTVSLDIKGDIASGSNLNKISGLSSADGNFIVGSPSGWVVESGNTARTSLGLGTGDTVTFATVNATNFNGGTLAATKITGSFSGSFIGDGSKLTGLAPSAVASYTNPADNRILTSVNSSTINGEANLTFDGSTLAVTGSISTTGNIAAAGGLQISSMTTLKGEVITSGVTTGTSDTVYIQVATNKMAKRNIDSRVWGTSLIDGSGASNRVAYFSDTDTVTSNAAFTYNGTNLTVGSSTFGTDVVIAGNLTVQGSSISQNVANVNIEDQFILLNSGSATGDGGIIVQTEAGFTGAAFGWDDSAARWAVQVNTKLGASATAMTPDAFVAMVVDVDGGITENESHKQNGNIKVSGGEIYIYA